MYLKICLIAMLCGLFCLYPSGRAALAKSAGSVQEPPVEEMIGQMLLVGFRGSDLSHPEVQSLLELVRQGKIGGIILFDYDASAKTYGRNVIDVEQVRKLCAAFAAASDVPLFISVDQEGGRVQRLKPSTGFKKWPSPKEAGVMGAGEVLALGRDMGRELADVGFNLDFAPGVDVDVNPDSPAIGRWGRSYGADPSVVTRLAGAFAKGLNESGIIACYKHFPGHGSSGTDTHLDLADVSKTWSEMELEPYRQLIHRPGRHMVMVGHLLIRELDDKYPASISRNIITGLLREKLGWNGVVISDDLQMKAVSDRYDMEQTVLLGVNAGMDILLFGNNLIHDPELPEKLFDTTLRLHREGRISHERIKQSYDRIMALKQGLN